MNNHNITQLRREIRATRRSLSPIVRARHSQALVRHLLRSALLWPAQRVACFWPNDGEVDLRSLFSPLWQRKIQLLLPVIDRQRLWFAPYTAGTPMRSNRFGIPEPAVKRRDACPLLAIDIVLMPLVAFDERGNRVGMGGGYYDRTLAIWHQRERLRGPLLIGAAFEFQRRQQLPVNKWDIPLHAVASEQGLQVF